MNDSKPHDAMHLDMLRMRQAGATFPQIAKKWGMSTPNVVYWLNSIRLADFEHDPVDFKPEPYEAPK